MGKVKLHSTSRDLLRKVYRGTAALLRKVAINCSAVDISIYLHLSQ